MNASSPLADKRVLRRFLAKIRVLESGCWGWRASKNLNGYPRLAIRDLDDRQHVHGAHRLSYEFFVGPIPDGLHLDHLCRNRECVNPTHLEPVTCAENVRRGELGVLRTSCVNGHEYTPENTRVTRHGWRKCRGCERDRAREQRRELRERGLTARGTPRVGRAPRTVAA